VVGAIRKDGLGRVAFLGLLVAQAQNQNPLEPQADGAFLAQLAQFSSLEQLQGMREDIATLLELAKTPQAVTPPSNGDI